MMERFVAKTLAMKRYAPFAAAFVLGVGSWWGIPNFASTGPAPVNVAMDQQRPAPTVTKRRAPASAATRQASSAAAGKQARLLRAVGKGDLGTVWRLLAARIKVDPVDEQGRGPLIRAVENGRNAVTELLIERRANVNVATDDGETALMIAARRGDPVPPTC